MPLTIDGTSFRSPNDVKIKNQKVYSKRRSANNTLITSVLNFNTKKVYEFRYDILNNSEFNFLESKNFGVRSINLTDSGYAFSGNYFVEFDSYTWLFSQNKSLKLTLTEV